MRFVFFAAMMSFAAAAGHAGNANIEETLGNQNYVGTKVKGTLDLPNEFYFQPSFSLYHDDLSSGTYKTFSGRLGYDEDSWGAGTTLGGSPKTNGYGNLFFGADGARYIKPGGKDETFGFGLSEADLGGGLTLTDHVDDFEQSPKGKGTVQRASALHVLEADFDFNALLIFQRWSLKLDFTQSVYNKNLESENARAARIAALAGLSGIIQGFPDQNFNVMWKWLDIRFLTPYLSFTHTTFEIGTPVANSYEVGTLGNYRRFRWKLAFEKIVQKINPDLNLFTVGAGITF